MDFNRPSLEAEGFTGWVRFAAIRASTCPPSGGVYVITYGAPPVFDAQSSGGRFKGKDPTVTRDALVANWVEGAEVVYIGKADQLRRRLIQFADFGAGKPAPHWGGRLIWQLASPQALCVAWKETPGEVPVKVEVALISAFRDIHGKPPFANIPHRLGA
jgi:hypothetical protein